MSIDLREEIARALYEHDPGWDPEPWEKTNARMRAEHRALLARVEVLEEALHKYADTLCEHSTCFEGCGKLSADECGGCPARAALEPKP